MQDDRFAHSRPARSVGSSRLVGWGVDRRPQDRPGVPKEHLPPEPVANASATVPLVQQVAGTVTAHGPLRSVTPVYGTANPTRGLSGIIRRAAYRVPDYKPRRWMMLMLADRIDVMEHNVAPIAMLLGGVALLIGGAFAVKRLREA